MYKIYVKDIEHVAFQLARELMSFNEPIPDFRTRYPDKLESCVSTPFQGIGGKHFYPSLINKASILFYLMIKNHPFQNGNKRIAMTTLMIFLSLNKKWIKVDARTFYEFAMLVTTSNPKDKDGIIKLIEGFLKQYMIDIQ